MHRLLILFLSIVIIPAGMPMSRKTINLFTETQPTIKKEEPVDIQKHSFYNNKKKAAGAQEREPLKTREHAALEPNTYYPDCTDSFKSEIAQDAGHNSLTRIVQDKNNSEIECIAPIPLAIIYAGNEQTW